MLVVPFTSDYDQRFTTQLADGNKYVFDARWNEFGQSWSFDLTRDADQVQLVAGAPLLIGQDLLAPYALGIGALLVTDLGQKNTDAGPDDLGERVIPFYLSPDELTAVRDALGADGRSLFGGSVAPPPPSGGGSSGGGGSGGGGVGGGGGGGGTTVINNFSTVNTFNVTGGTGGFGDKFEALDDSTGNEVLIGRFLQMPGLNPNPTVALKAAILASGTGTLRFYVGGTLEAFGSTGVPSGTLVDSASVSSAGENVYEFDQSMANPGLTVAVKVTMQSGGVGTPIGVSIITGFLG